MQLFIQKLEELRKFKSGERQGVARESPVMISGMFDTRNRWFTRAHKEATQASRALATFLCVYNSCQKTLLLSPRGPYLKSLFSYLFILMGDKQTDYWAHFWPPLQYCDSILFLCHLESSSNLRFISTHRHRFSWMEGKWSYSKDSDTLT